jgi:hypothetical protein
MGFVSTLMGLKPHLSHSGWFSARLKSCPFARVRQIQGFVSTLMGLKPHLSHLRWFSALLKSCPFARVRQIDGFCQHADGAEAPPLSFKVVFGTTEVVPLCTCPSD